jgi:hypothetical protein
MSQSQSRSKPHTHEDKSSRMIQLSQVSVKIPPPDFVHRTIESVLYTMYRYVRNARKSRARKSPRQLSAKKFWKTTPGEPSTPSCSFQLANKNARHAKEHTHSDGFTCKATERRQPCVAVSNLLLVHIPSRSSLNLSQISTPSQQSHNEVLRRRSSRSAHGRQGTGL